MTLDYLEDVMRKISMPQSVAEAVINTYDKIDPAIVNSLNNRLFNGENIVTDFLPIADSCNVSEGLFSLTVLLLLTKTMKSNYLKKGFSEDFWISNLRDFIIWEKVYERKNGQPGISENVWITYSLTQKIFRIGRLQFELIQMPYDDCIIGATHILKGQPVINIHIPEDGPFTRKMRYESYSDAYSFYQKMLNLNDYIPFLCDSWLLFSEHKNMLPESSNIRDFFHDFKIIRDVETPGRLNNLWRVFGFLSQGYSDYQNLPENTTLQRGYKKQLIQNNSTGRGVGVFLYNGQRFIR